MALQMTMALQGYSNFLEESHSTWNLNDIGSSANTMNRKLEESSNNVLIIGDSWAEFAMSSLDSYCGGATSYNFGESGEVATAWVDGVPDDVQEAFSNGVAYDSVYFTIGGNDVLESGCTLPQEDVQNVVTDALSTVVRQVGDTVPIIMTGYCSPTACQEECEQELDTTALYESLNVGIGAACEATTSCTFVDAWRVCDFNSTTGFSSGVFHEDPIHTSDAGYCKVFELPDVQAAFNCDGEETIDCGDGDPTNRCEDDCRSVLKPFLRGFF